MLGKVKVSRAFFFIYVFEQVDFCHLSLLSVLLLHAFAIAFLMPAVRHISPLWNESKPIAGVSYNILCMDGLNTMANFSVSHSVLTHVIVMSIVAFLITAANFVVLVLPRIAIRDSTPDVGIFYSS